jgi:RNase H-fold protein (predicted Holliday junction resolvase)
VQEVLDIAKENAVAGVVIGESRDYQGKENPLMKNIAVFIEQLKDAGLDVALEPEFMSSMMAARQFAPEEKSRKQMPSQEKLDASAAALILQNYLDRMRQRPEVE